jgi:acetoacetyl-CoA reductase
MAENKHRVALVTGGMGGLGEAICLKLAALGNTVVTTHSPGNTRAPEWLDTMKRQGYGFHAYPCDVVDWDSCVSCVANVTKDVGPVEVLVNNAGITRDMTFKKMDKANWDAVIRTNLDSCFNMAKQVCDGMVERGWGRIINISSVNGQKGAFGQVNYSAAKAGMHGFTKALALELAPRRITVNAVCPGWVDTEMAAASMRAQAQRDGLSIEEFRARALAETPQARMLDPAEVAGLVLYLCLPESRGVTGQAWSIG